MKNSSLPKMLFLAIALFSLFSFAYVNWQTVEAKHCSPAPATLVQPDPAVQEEQPEEAGGSSRLPDVVLLGYLLQLAGKFLPIAN